LLTVPLQVRACPAFVKRAFSAARESKDHP
jgi:hypothetical protein